MILAHEEVHLARGDARLNALAALIRCLCWFNPLVHVAVSLMRIDQELACDAVVVLRHPKSRQAYAQAMLKTELADWPLPLGCYWPAGTRHPLAERIALLKSNRPSRRRRLAGAGAVILLAAGFGLAAWGAQPARVRLIQVAAPPVQSQAPAAASTLKSMQTPPARPARLQAVSLQVAPPAPAAPDSNDPLILPPRVPFARDFDGDRALKLTGRVVGTRDEDGHLMATVKAERIDLVANSSAPTTTGVDWDVQLGESQTIGAEARAKLAAGVEIVARGYAAKDGRCRPTCMLARDVTFPEAGGYLSSTADTSIGVLMRVMSVEWLPSGARLHGVSLPISAQGNPVVAAMTPPGGQAWVVDTGMSRAFLAGMGATSDNLVGTSLIVNLYPAAGLSCPGECKGVAHQITFKDFRRAWWPMGPPNTADPSAALASGEWRDAALQGAPAAQVVRAAQARRQVSADLDPTASAVVIGPDGVILAAHAMTPLAR